MSLTRRQLSQPQTGLLKAGYIPSKATFKSMIDGLGLHPDVSFTSVGSKKGKTAEPSDGNFEFLLFVLDSLEDRKLTVDSSFYSSILVLGAKAGGLQKRVASLLAQSRKLSNQKEITLSERELSDESSTRHVKWEDLLVNYSTYKEGLGSSIILPPIYVSSREFGRVIAAEQAVTYRGGRESYVR